MTEIVLLLAFLVLRLGEKKCSRHLVEKIIRVFQTSPASVLDKWSGATAPTPRDAFCGLFQKNTVLNLDFIILIFPCILQGCGDLRN